MPKKQRQDSENQGLERALARIDRVILRTVRDRGEQLELSYAYRATCKKMAERGNSPFKITQWVREATRRLEKQ